MDKENNSVAAVKVEGQQQPATRITRARAKALGVSGGMPPLVPRPKPSLKDENKRALRVHSKRTASDDIKASVTAVNGLQHKRRAVLKDVTNLNCENLLGNCTNASRVQTGKPAGKFPIKKNAMIVDITMKISEAQEDVKTRLAEELSKIRMAEAQDINLSAKNGKQCVADSVLSVTFPDRRHSPSDLNIFSKKMESSLGQDVVDIDKNTKDPQICGLYAPDIYSNRRVKELEQRPSTNYMERLQKDITPSMRAILVDWLVEVSEEYRLVPDTLYLTVNLIDRFLSENFIEKQRLQLLGVTCMQIAAKYEEICPPRVEEFCLITDNTYSKREVLRMESQVLNFLYFQVSVPTVKTFLRRFIQAAQASCKNSSIELEFLANYLAELTLVEYDFLKFLPSLIAASAVFLARWTLDQSDHPWNSTLKHYTSYDESELKATVIALEDLHLNKNSCSLSAIRDKYRDQKFKCVATLSSSRRVLSLFQR